MNVLVIDGQGGRIGRQLVKEITERFKGVSLTAVGTNSIATGSMLKGGAQNAATGENAVMVAARRADVIIGPIGIVIADALLGEVTAEMATAVGRSRATRILIPINKCDSVVAGVGDKSTAELIDDALGRLAGIIAERG